MIQHGASCLAGPLTCQRAWWGQADGETNFQPERQEADQGIRTALVARVRKAIAEGTYDTPEKMELALERMLEDLR